MFTTHQLIIYIQKIFSSMLSVCDPLNLFVVGGRSFVLFFKYGDSVRSLPMFLLLRIVFSLVNKHEYILSPYFVDHIYVITQFSLQNKAVECCV